MTTVIDISAATVVTLCVIGVLWWLLKKRKKAKPQPAPQPQDPPPTPPK